MFSAIFQLLALSSSYAFPIYVLVMSAEQLEKAILLSGFLSAWKYTNLGDLLIMFVEIQLTSIAFECMETCSWEKETKVWVGDRRILCLQWVES